jgi:hypothetical protein
MHDASIQRRDVPETMLWTLHNRVNEAKRPDARSTDPDCIRFDTTILEWVARKTLKGYARTKCYTAPPMRWGVNRTRIVPLLKGWSKALKVAT